MAENSHISDQQHLEGYVVPPLSKEEIKEYAKPYLDFWNRNDLGRFNPLLFLDTLYTLIDKDFSLVSKSKDQMGSLLGLATPAKNLIEIREDVYYRALEGSHEAQLVIAHEFGHFCMHQNIRFPKLADESTPNEQSAEWQANYFADVLMGLDSQPIQMELFGE